MLQGQSLIGQFHFEKIAVFHDLELNANHCVFPEEQQEPNFLQLLKNRNFLLTNLEKHKQQPSQPAYLLITWKHFVH